MDQNIQNLIDALENGDIVIDGRNAPPITIEEIEEYKKIRQEHYDALSAYEKKEIYKFIKRLEKRG